MIKKLKRREECDTYLTHLCRRHSCADSPMERWNIRSFQPTLWLSSAISTTVMSTDISLVDVTLSFFLTFGKHGDFFKPWDKVCYYWKKQQCWPKAPVVCFCYNVEIIPGWRCIWKVKWSGVASLSLWMIQTSFPEKCDDDGVRYWWVPVGRSSWLYSL